MPALEHAYAKLQEFLAELLDDAVKASELKATTNEVARTLLSAMCGFKLVATDGKDLRRLIAMQVTLVTAALGQYTSNVNRSQKRGLSGGRSRKTA